MKQRKMAIVSRVVKMGEEDSEDVRCRLARSPQERIAEVTRLRFGATVLFW